MKYDYYKWLTKVTVIILSGSQVICNRDITVTLKILTKESFDGHDERGIGIPRV
jgi:hypothetical protein